MPDILIQNGKLLTITQGILDETDILLRDGRIAKIEKNIRSRKADFIYDARGKWIMPGLIDCHTHLGLDETNVWDNVNELNEIGDPITPTLRCIDGFNPNDEAIELALRHGITSAVSHTGSIQLLSGQSATFKLIPSRSVAEMTRNPLHGIKGGFGGTPKLFYYQEKIPPSTRLSEAAILRQTFADAVAYKNGWNLSSKATRSYLQKLNSLIPLINREVPWCVHVYKLYDINTCMRIAEEFNLRLILEHGGEASLIASELAQQNVFVTVGPSGFIGSIKPETFFPVMENLGSLIEAGVVFGFQTDHPIIHIASLPQAVATIIQQGFINEEEALKALTLNGAKIINEPDLGCLEVGKTADIIITDGSIFDFFTKVEKVFIDGELVFEL